MFWKQKKRRTGYHERLRKEEQHTRLVRDAKRFQSWFLGHGLRPLALLCGVVLLVGIAALAWNTLQPLQYITLQNIQITGNQNLSKEAIEKLLPVHRGQPMNLVNADTIRARLTRSTLILDVPETRVEIPLFSRTVEIHVREATPLFKMQLAPGLWQIYSEKGVPFSAANMALPIVSAPGPADFEQAIRFLQEIKQSDPALYKKVSQVSANAPKNSLEVVFSHAPQVVRFAGAGRDSQVYKNYKLLLLALGDSLSRTSQIDLRFPGFAYTSKEGGNG
jgi:cell division septal protein FtsQ